VPAVLVLIVGSELIRTSVERWFNAPMDEVLSRRPTKSPATTTTSGSCWSPTAATDVLQSYAWPGNVRELRNVIERLMIMVPGDVISADDLGFLDPAGFARTAGLDAPAERMTLHEARDRFERELILRTLAEQQGNMSRTAEVLGVERSNLYRKMKAFGIAPSRRADEDSEPVGT